MVWKLLKGLVATTCTIIGIWCISSVVADPSSNLWIGVIGGLAVGLGTAVLNK